jgi:NADH-quinone oxidoreductase subunit M
LELSLSDKKTSERLVPYTSISHMGFVLIGVFAWNELALQGTLMQMICHGISTGGLFILVGLLQERIKTRDMDRIGGLWFQHRKWAV